MAGRPLAMGAQVETVNPQELYQVVVGAASQDANVMRASANRLKQMLEMFGTFDSLQAISIQRNEALSVRQQAIIQLKNGVLSSWKSRKLLSDEHREQIRQRCLLFLDEPDQTIADFNEIIVSKIARSDYPTTWPNLIPFIFETIDTGLKRRYALNINDPVDTLKLRRSLQLLNGVIKEFASVKMPSGMKVMAQISEHVKDLLFQYYAQMSTSFSPANLTPDSAQTITPQENIFLSHSVFKCLVKITVWTWSKVGRLSEEEKSQNQAWVANVFHSSAAQLRSLIETRKTLVSATIQDKSRETPQFTQTLIILNKHIRLFGKFFRRLQQLSHDRFVALPDAPELILFYWSQVAESSTLPQEYITDSDEAPIPVRFLVQGMVIFKESLSQWTAIKRNGTVNANSLSADFVKDAAQLLVMRFIPLNPSDLENWMSDPEEWVSTEDKEQEQWEYEIRGCAERLLVQLCNQYSETVVPLLKDIFEKVTPQTGRDLQSIITKEAVYCAVGRCVQRLKDAIPFDFWLNNYLAVEARYPETEYSIVKRRIAWVLGKWVSAAATSPNNPKIWEILSHLIQERNADTDVAVRLTSVAALRECVDAVSFDPNVFAPCLPTVVPSLIRLMREAETLETKRRIDESLNTIIEQSGQLILPFINVITEPLPELWQSAGEDLLFKASLLVTTSRLVEATKENSSALAYLVVPLIKDSLSPSHIVQLDQDALDLWKIALRNTTTLLGNNGPGLFDLFLDALNLLSSNIDVLGSVTDILESYYILDAATILQNAAAPLFQAYRTAFSNKLLEANTRQLVQSLTLLFSMSPANIWAEPLHTSGLFPFLLKTLAAGETETLVTNDLIFLFARIIMADKQTFLQLVAASSVSLGQPEELIYDNLLDQWWAKFDNLSEPQHRKLSAMGIAVLVSTGRPEALKRLSGETFNIWLDVLGELKEVMEPSHQVSGRTSPTNLTRFWDLDNPPDSYFRDSEGTPEYDRRRAIYNQDPIRTVELVSFINSNLQEAERASGPAFASYLASADPLVVSQLQAALAHPAT